MTVAGCTGLQSGGGQETTTTTQDTTTTQTTTTETTEPTEEQPTTTTEAEAVLSVRETDRYGDVVVGPEGLSLYMFDKDPQNGDTSVCTGSCADAWPPLTVEESGSIPVGTGITGSVGTIQRSDGTSQVTLGGWPLYYYQGDSAPGDVSGVGVAKAWWLLDGQGRALEPAVQVREHQEYGQILTGPDGRSLYMFDSDTQGSGQSTCSGGCADAWPPLTVDSDAPVLKSSAVDADVGTITRSDGQTQVTVDGWPVYYFQNDSAEGDVNGQGVQDVWWLLGADGSVLRADSGMSQNQTTTTTTTTTTTEEEDDDGGDGGGIDYFLDI